MIPHKVERGGLVLSRRRGETLVLETTDGPITVKLLRVKGKRAALWIAAPAIVRIRREHAERCSPSREETR